MMSQKYEMYFGHSLHRYLYSLPSPNMLDLTMSGYEYGL